MECLFQLTAYNYPDTITVPTEYTPPAMAIATAYWKAWSILGECPTKCWVIISDITTRSLMTPYY